MQWFLMVSVCALIASANSAAAELSVEQAARIYRIQVYATFHAQRDEYDRRRGAGDELFTRWKDSGRREQESEVVRWFQDATLVSQAERVELLPVQPQWTAVTASDPAPSPPAAARSKPTANAAKPTTPEKEKDKDSLELLRSMGRALFSGLEGK